MKSKKLVIQINKPVSEVFDFVINPTNTPKWIDWMAIEQTNEMPPRLGTIYRNQNKSGGWNEYEMTVFKPNKMFTMSNYKGHYNVRYTLKPITDNSTELEYYEWVEKGKLAEAFTMDILEKLKLALEKTE